MAKKIIALVTAIALVVCFAVSASAVLNVATTTQYVGGSSADIKVNVTVTGTEGEIAEGTNVTYYATKDSVPVHIDQAKATATGAAFEFNTAATNLESTVKVGYTNASAATDAVIEGYTVTYPNGSMYVPNSGVTTVTFPHSFGEGKVLSEVTVSNGTATVANEEYANGNVTVTFDAALTGDITLAVAEDWAPAGTVTAVAEHIESAALVVKLAEDSETYNGGIKIDAIKESLDVNAEDIKDADEIAAANADKVGDRKLTVIGQVTQAEVYGIIVSTTAIGTTNVGEAEFNATYKADAYEGATKNAEGIFAIQLIDTSTTEADAFVKAGATYYTAVYAQDATGAYVITAGDTVVVD